jgi:hypothetical protein
MFTNYWYHLLIGTHLLFPFLPLFLITLNCKFLQIGQDASEGTPELHATSLGCLVASGSSQLLRGLGD